MKIIKKYTFCILVLLVLIAYVGIRIMFPRFFSVANGIKVTSVSIHDVTNLYKTDNEYNVQTVTLYIVSHTIRVYSNGKKQYILSKEEASRFVMNCDKVKLIDSETEYEISKEAALEMIEENNLI